MLVRQSFLIAFHARSREINLNIALLVALRGDWLVVVIPAISKEYKEQFLVCLEQTSYAYFTSFASRCVCANHDYELSSAMELTLK